MSGRYSLEQTFDILCEPGFACCTPAKMVKASNLRGVIDCM